MKPLPRAADNGRAGTASREAVWIDLLARLSLCATAGQHPDTRRRLRALGVKRTDTLASILRRELVAAQSLASASGGAPQALALLRRVGELARRAPMEWHLLQLVQAYDGLAEHPEHQNRKVMQSWIRARRYVHSLQARELEAVPSQLTVFAPIASSCRLTF